MPKHYINSSLDKLVVLGFWPLACWKRDSTFASCNRTSGSAISFIPTLAVSSLGAACGATFLLAAACPRT